MFTELETPALLIDDDILERNLLSMQALADRSGVKLRLHVKTHKIPALALRQIAAGAVGIAVAKLSEAEIMANHGISDIQIANQVVGLQKITRLRDLARRIRVSCAVDGIDQVNKLAQAFSSEPCPLNLLIEIDTGLHRCGLTNPDLIIKLARSIGSLQGVRFLGLITHAGHAYATVGHPEKRQEIARGEGEQLTTIAKRLRSEGIEVETVSVGSTPTARDVVRVSGVTELRVGVYIFNDMIQVALGVSTIADCALSVLATVISVPADDRVVIDAGSKSLSLDLGAHGTSSVSGYGKIIGRDAQLSRLSEEHGVITHRGETFRIGERVRIIPNHACATVNLYDRAYLVRRDAVIDQLKIEARGCLT